MNLIEKVSNEIWKTYKEAILKLSEVMYKLKTKHFDLEKEVREIDIVEVLDAWKLLDDYSNKLLDMIVGMNKDFEGFKEFFKSEIKREE